MNKITATISGHVQGVGFRYQTHNIAKRFDIVGYVMNKPDGNVELVAEGERHELDLFIAAVNDELSQFIRDVKLDVSAPSKLYTQFQIKR